MDNRRAIHHRTPQLPGRHRRQHSHLAGRRLCSLYSDGLDGNPGVPIAHTYGDANSDFYTDPDSNGDSYGHSDVHAYTHCDSHAYSDAYGDTYSDSNPNSNTRPSDCHY